jgi:protein SCO1/2
MSALRAATAVGALGAILAITAAWWALALWPADAASPAWLLRTREVCFGAAGDALPSSGGWLLLIGQPIGMIGVLVAVWATELRAGLRLAMSRVTGQLAIGAALALVVAGLGAAAVRVRAAGIETFSTGTAEIARQLTRLDDAAPALALVDQAGRRVTLESLAGRPVLVSFAYAHCETVCPAIVSDLLAVQQRTEVDRPVVLVVTLDPWRDTPARLASIASAWHLGRDAYVLSGPPDEVERTLNRWRVPRTRNATSGDILHPSMVYVVGRNGRITYVLTGGADIIAAAVRGL